MVAKHLISSIIIILLSIGVDIEKGWPQYSSKEVIITAQRLNVRDNIGGRKVGVVTGGQQFKIKEIKENWGEIEFETGKLGWISLQFTRNVDKQKSVASERAIRPSNDESKLMTGTEKTRQALVIGNSNYSDAGVLRNPVNDAEAIGNELMQLGFKVKTIINADQKKMEREIRDFGKQLMHNKGVGLFYYAGHGMQFGGENYLMPTDYDLNTLEEEVRYYAVPLGKVLAQMQAADNGMNVVILDACRNNPFARSFRSGSKGLAQVTAPTGSFISYATAPGSVAADGDGQNGLYTEKLLKHIKTPNLTIEEVFKRVRIDVQRESNKKQVPWDSSSLIGNFYFKSKIEEPPKVGKVKLNDLNIVSKTEKEILDNWEKYQKDLSEDFQRISDFEKKTENPANRLEIWLRFLRNWSTDNPMTNDDDEFRKIAKTKIEKINKILAEKTQIEETEKGNETDNNQLRLIERIKKFNRCSRCYLVKIDLSEFQLMGVNMENSDLTEAILNKTNMNDSSMEGAKLNKSNLKGVQLKRANLKRVILRESFLSEANMSEANMSGADLSDSYIWDANIRKAILRNANLSGANLKNSNLSGSNLSGVNLEGANLSGTNLSNVNLENANLKGAILLSDMRNIRLCNTTMPDGSVNNRNC